jgi:uncharacterized membrane protein YraQ (UPF0718 family)
MMTRNFIAGMMAGWVLSEAVWSYIGGDVVVAAILAAVTLFLVPIGVSERLP